MIGGGEGGGGLLVGGRCKEKVTAEDISAAASGAGIWATQEPRKCSVMEATVGHILTGMWATFLTFFLPCIFSQEERG